MSKFIIVLSVISMIFSSTCSYAQMSIRGSNSANQKPSTDLPDCITKFVNDGTGFKFSTKNGKEFSAFTDALKRVVFIKSNGRSYRPVYDKNFPNKLVSVRSLDDGTEAFMSEHNTMLAPLSSKEKLRKLISNNPISLCSNNIKNKHKVDALTSSATPTRISQRGLQAYGEDWDSFDFYTEYIETPYWEGEMQPYFDEAVSDAAQENTTRSCVERASACSDACDDEADKRSYSCAALVLIYFEIPVGAALAGIACAVASNNQKKKCKASCPQIADCF